MINILRIHTQVKHNWIYFFFETKCNNSTFADRLFKSVFKSWRSEKHATKRYFKITTINYMISANDQNRTWIDFKIIFFKTVVLYEIYRKNRKCPNTVCSSMRICESWSFLETIAWWCNNVILCIYGYEVILD